jgi:hypothetical protein
MRNRSKGAKIAMMIVLGIGAIFLFGFIVMSLWNAILVPVLGIGAVSFWQALGILVLCKILFGGFKGRGGFGGPPGWKNEMREKWQHMTPEEREQVKQQWREKCRHWGRRSYTESSKPDTGTTTTASE